MHAGAHLQVLLGGGAGGLHQAPAEALQRQPGYQTEHHHAPAIRGSANRPDRLPTHRISAEGGMILLALLHLLVSYHDAHTNVYHCSISLIE